ncbi:MAG: hypothetical protein SF123_17160 [Chloroflexota bacterium]|nr:hypothetical protein [Chloroflexota bacterium]
MRGAAGTYPRGSRDVEPHIRHHSVFWGCDQSGCEVSAAERGRFLFDREGRAVFWRRHRLLMSQAIAATFNDVMTDLSYAFAGVDQLKNEVVVTCQPRTLGTTATEILWQLDETMIPVAPDPLNPRKLYIKYTDSSGNRIGAQNVTLTDVTFAQGTATYTITPKANGAEIVFTNNGAVEAWVKTAIVRGRKITSFDRMEATARNEASITNYGRRTLRMNMPSITRLEDAQEIANFERDRRSTPRGQVSSISVASHGKTGGGYHAQQLALTLGDRIAVQETQTGHSANYIIIGEAHTLTMSGTLYQTSWYLEPAPTAAFNPWILDDLVYSKLDTTTKLVY